MLSNCLRLKIFSFLFFVCVTFLFLHNVTAQESKARPKKAAKPEIKVANPDLVNQLSDFNLSYAERQIVAKKIETQTGILPWVPLSPEERKLRLADQMSEIKEYIAVFPKLKCHETRYFLFVSDAPEDVYKDISHLLDKMYEVLCNLYNVPYEYETTDGTILPETTKPIPAQAKKYRKNIWQSKCTVVVFMNSTDYTNFELKFYHQSVPGCVIGLCHQRTNGIVTISCKSAPNKYDFYETLVHETTHGFTFMHNTVQPLPLWLDEGIADWIAKAMVPKGTNIPAKQKEAVFILKRTHSLDSLFYKEQTLQAWQYGAAAMTVHLLLKKNPKSFVTYIDAIKNGENPERALKRIYKINYAKLANALGMMNGVKGVTVK